MHLTLDFFQSSDVVSLSQALIGKVLLTYFDGIITSGRIVETEAYKGPEDRASHAYNYRRTERTKVMYEIGGTVYVYLCYGMHSLFNIVTGPKETPHAILIRAIEPLEGISQMLERRKKNSLSRFLTAGPGALAQALGINRSHSGQLLEKNKIWIEEGSVIHPLEITASPRVGIAYAGEDALLPWRFKLKRLSTK